MKIVLSAGHRNTNRGGAGREIDWTYPHVKRIEKEAVRRGHTVFVVSELDGDSDPSFSHGRGLQNVAYLAAEIAKRERAEVYLSVHYEGAAHKIRGCFGIYPDGDRLYPAASYDGAANNPLDIRVASAIAKHVGRTGMPIRNGGTMSERATYVGGQGSRLGEFHGTRGVQATTARVIFEYGQYESPADRAMLWSDEWCNRAASATVDGLEEVFGKGSDEPKPEPKPEPEYAKPIVIGAVQDEKPMIVLDNGAVLVRVEATGTAIRETPRMQAAHAGSNSIGPDLEKGEGPFVLDYLIINPDRSLYWLTPWWTRLQFDDVQVG